jgi:integrase
LLSQINKGIYVHSSDKTLEEHLNDWLELSAKQRLRETTFKNYKRAVEFRIIPALGKVKLDEIKLGHGQAFVKQLFDDGLSPRYIEYICTLLKNALDQAVDWELIHRNPLKKLEIPRPRRTSNYTTWSLEEANRFLHFAKFENIMYYTLFLVMINTGMRRGEVLGLRWKDLDLENGKINIIQTLVYDENEFKFNEPKTESSKRQIAIDEFVCNEIRKYKKQQNEFKLALGSCYHDMGLVFCREDGRPIYPRQLAIVFDRIIKKAGVPKIRLHDLRHTHATFLLKLGENPKVVSERLGHSRVEMTLDIYSHVLPDMQENAAKKLSEALRNSKIN